MKKQNRKKDMAAVKWMYRVSKKHLGSVMIYGVLSVVLAAVGVLSAFGTKNIVNGAVYGDFELFKRGAILLGVILYITNRYQAQKEMIEEEKLRTELTDWKYRNMTRKSQLTMRTRQSQLELQLKALGDSTLKVSKIPPYILSVEK
jgi:hypothetical protein